MRVLIEFDNRPLLFEDPVCVLECRDASDLADCCEHVESLLDDGFYVAGFVSYEAGYALEPRLRGKCGSDFPLMSFGCFRAPRRKRPEYFGRPKYSVNRVENASSRSQYTADIGRIREYIAAGEVYQITYCRKLKFAFSGEPYGLYRQLLRDQPVPFPAYLEAGRYHILSLSPEMFIRKQGVTAVTRPMKGSWPCGQGWLADLLAGHRLARDPKNRAENVMIADLLRNDLGRIGTGIHVPRLFEAACYRTIWQMTSTVTAQVPRELSLQSWLEALFPSGSVTGAPKVRAMEIVRELEQEERKIYTGAIGYISPERNMFFNVPIRTLLLDGQQGEMGIGGGIVWDSTADGEWDEGEWKARFFTRLATGRP
ncbi:MAG: hypothetical protein HGA80_05340 [Candidatus Omnitrophica bacterium]|nr:hypothetical protein [Candidatus Omnitrophota bacterium]